MSYPPQWSNSNMIPAGTNLSAQGDTIQNTAIFSPFPSSTPIRQAPPIHMQINQAHPGQNATGFCPPPPGAYSLVYPPLVAAFAAQSNAAAVQSGQGPRFCIPQPSPSANAAAAFRGTALLSAPTALQAAAPPPQQAQTAPTQQLPPLSYFPGINGLPLAPAFPGAATAPSFPPHGASLPQQHGGPFLSTQFRAYDSLKHFGALPQATSHKKNKSMTTSKTNLYITGLSESDTDETVRALVEDIVHPKSCKAMLLNGKCKGSGFIDCVTAEDAVKALNHLTEMSRNGGRQLIVKYALENEKDSYNIYVRNLPKTNFSKEALMSLFTPYGQVTSVKLLETEGVYTGIGFVRFASAEQAQHAVESVNEKRYILCEADSANGNGGALKPVTCKLADKADPKRRAAAAAAAVAASGSVPPATSPSAGPSTSRGKFHNPRHGQHHAQAQQQSVLPLHTPQQPQQPFDMHLQGHQHQNMTNALAALNQNHQIPPGLIYQPGMIPDTASMFAAAAAAGGYLPTANGPNPGLLQSSPRIASTDTVSVGTNAAVTSGTPTSSATSGLLEIPAPQASPSAPNVDQAQQQQTQQSQHHLLSHPQVAAVNGHSTSPAVDSRYAAHVAAAIAAANNAMIYPSSTHQFPRVSSQQPLVQPTYSIANPHQAQTQNPYVQPNPVDLTAEQLQSLSLTAAAAAAAAVGRQPGGQPQPFYPDWQAVAGFQAGVPATISYQPVTSASDAAYMDQALAAAALLNNYVHVPPPIAQTQQLTVQSTPPVTETFENSEGTNPESRESEESNDGKLKTTTSKAAKAESLNDKESVDKAKEKSAPEETRKKIEGNGTAEEKQQQQQPVSSTSS